MSPELGPQNVFPSDLWFQNQTMFILVQKTASKSVSHKPSVLATPFRLSYKYRGIHKTAESNISLLFVASLGPPGS